MPADRVKQIRTHSSIHTSVRLTLLLDELQFPFVSRLSLQVFVQLQCLVIDLSVVAPIKRMPEEDHVLE